MRVSLTELPSLLQLSSSIALISPHHHHHLSVCTATPSLNILYSSQWSYTGWQNLNLLSHPNAILASQARQAKASGEKLNYVTLAPHGRPSGENFNYSLSIESLVWYSKIVFLQVSLSTLTQCLYHLKQRENVMKIMFSLEEIFSSSPLTGVTSIVATLKVLWSKPSKIRTPLKTTTTTMSLH